LEEVAEASVEELASVDGIADAAAATALKERASSTMERLRRQRIDEACTRVEPPTDREILRMVRGVGLRTLQFLEEGGYRSVSDVAREDPDRLSIRTGLSNKKARSVQDNAHAFLAQEWPTIEGARARIPADAARSAAAETAQG
jgi:N utilization substance protein A